jgi:short-subunit dehydrogenase
MSLRRYRAIVVGATGGIGNAITRALAPRCDALLLVGRNAPCLEGLAQAIGGASSVSFVAADIGTAAGCATVLEAARRMAGVDLVVNSAGTGQFAWLADLSDEAVERIVVTNLLGPMQLVRRLLPLLQEQPAATIVNVGSIFGYLGYPGCAAYSASKFGLRGFTEALRRELAGGPVRVMYLAPRSTRTPLNSDAMYALNARLGVAVDDPQVVAQALLRLLAAPRRERLLGFPEALFARLNQLLPGIVDHALARQLPHIRRHARGGDDVATSSERSAETTS